MRLSDYFPEKIEFETQRAPEPIGSGAKNGLEYYEMQEAGCVLVRRTTALRSDREDVLLSALPA